MKKGIENIVISLMAASVLAVSGCSNRISSPQEATRSLYKSIKKQDVNLYMKVIGSAGSDISVYSGDIQRIRSACLNRTGLQIEDCYVELDLKDSEERGVRDMGPISMMIYGAKFEIHSRKNPERFFYMPAQIYKTSDGNWHAAVRF
jgi:hypothetical protein